MVPRLLKKELPELLGSDQPNRVGALSYARKKRRVTNPYLAMSDKPAMSADQPVVALLATKTSSRPPGSRPLHGRVRGPTWSGSRLPFLHVSDCHRTLRDFEGLYEGGGEALSFWNVKRDLGSFVDESLMNNVDDKTLKGPGHLGLCRALTTYGLRSVVLAWSLENIVMQWEVLLDKLS